MKKVLVVLLALCLAISFSFARQDKSPMPDSGKGTMAGCCMKGKDAKASMECCMKGKDAKASMECCMKGKDAKASIEGCKEGKASDASAECKEMKSAKEAGGNKGCCPEGKMKGKMEKMKGKARDAKAS